MLRVAVHSCLVHDQLSVPCAPCGELHVAALFAYLHLSLISSDIHHCLAKGDSCLLGVCLSMAAQMACVIESTNLSRSLVASMSMLADTSASCRCCINILIKAGQFTFSRVNAVSLNWG